VEARQPFKKLNSCRAFYFSSLFVGTRYGHASKWTSHVQKLGRCEKEKEQAMKREDLKAKGLTDEMIDFVMAENGKDIEKHKVEATTAKTAADTIQAQLAEANKTIEGFKGMDIEGVKKSAEEYRLAAEKATKDATAQVAQLKFDHALDGALTGAKAKNAKAVKALLNSADLKLAEDGSIVGLKDQLEKIKSENDYLFESEGSNPQIVLGGNNKTVITDKVVDTARKYAGLQSEK
jgi:hypothetical protein